MNLAYQIDNAFKPGVPISRGSTQQHFLSDETFDCKRESEIVLETGLEEAPKVVLTTSKQPSNDLMEKVQKVFERFRQLKSLTPGWDSYRGGQVHRTAIKPALEIVLASILMCKVPRIHPNSEGGIDLIWEDGVKELSMSVDANGCFEVLLETLGLDSEEPEGTVDLSQARTYLERFCVVQ